MWAYGSICKQLLSCKCLKEYSCNAPGEVPYYSVEKAMINALISLNLLSMLWQQSSSHCSARQLLTDYCCPVAELKQEFCPHISHEADCGRSSPSFLYQSLSLQ